MKPFIPDTPLIDMPVPEVKSESLIVTDRTQLMIPSVPFDFENPPMDPIELGALLVRQLVDHGGLGVSAVQIGLPYRVCVIRANPHVVIFNPVIVHRSDETVTEVEGCLSFPGLLVKVKRAKEIRVRFRYPNQDVRTEKWTGLTARVVQHEIDHMDGTLFFNKVGKFHRDQAFRQWDKLKRAKRDFLKEK